MPEIELRDLAEADLESLQWAGSPTHISYLRQAMLRAQAGEIDLLVAISADRPIGHGAIDFCAVPGAAKIWMLTVHPDFRSRGVGAAMMQALELSAKRHSFDECTLSVEKKNVRARDLYERLGWSVAGTTIENWVEETADGELFDYSTQCWVMTKAMSADNET